MNNPSSNTNEKKCEFCGSNRSYTANEDGTTYQKWNSNPYKEGTWMCRKCYTNLLYLKMHPITFVPRRKHKKVSKSNDD